MKNEVKVLIEEKLNQYGKVELIENNNLSVYVDCSLLFKIHSNEATFDAYGDGALEKLSQYVDSAVDFWFKRSTSFFCPKFNLFQNRVEMVEDIIFNSPYRFSISRVKQDGTKLTVLDTKTMVVLDERSQIEPIDYEQELFSIDDYINISDEELEALVHKKIESLGIPVHTLTEDDLPF